MWTDGRRTKTIPKTSPEQSAIFQIVREINKTNCSITRKNAPPPWRPYIYKTNLFTKFHDDWANNVTSRVFTSFFYYINIRKLLPPPPGSHVIQLTGTIFELNSCIKETNVLTKFHENWAKNVTSRVFTYFNNIHIEKNAPPTGVHVFSPIWTISISSEISIKPIFFQRTGTTFELNRHIIKANILTKFHENWAKNVTFRVFTCFHYKHIEKNASPTGGYVFSLISTIFEIVREINKTNVLTNFHIKETNVLTKFHENLAKNVTSRVFTCFHYIHIEKNAPPTGGHVFSPISTIFEIVREINKTNVLTNFHDWAKIVTSRKTAPPTGGHVFQRTGTTFELNQPIIKTNILTNFELDRDFIGTKLLTKFHEDRKINVASRVFTNKC
ncbi:hypothetical protein DPMN_010913 [Dreissena polymorpha]|uniref:Uncharacterized protein n=1 Tax=Dreissena polymorpha TaxID=45954 RepID=A0A9D4N323_DREPO|nr:hypothetical protein DPMN_010913 [Dreissena polymorpha]